MKPIPDFDKIPAATDRERLAPGGYVLKMTDVEDFPKKEYLRIVYDIAEGPEAGRYSDDWGRDHEFAHAFLRSYTTTPNPSTEWKNRRFRKFTDAVEASNDGYKWEWNESSLEGKLVGAVLGLEEYETERGEVKTRLYVAATISADRVRAGEFTVPELKKLAGGGDMKPAPEVTFGAPVKDDEIPF